MLPSAKLIRIHKFQSYKGHQELQIEDYQPKVPISSLISTYIAELDKTESR